MKLVKSIIAASILGSAPFVYAGSASLAHFDGSATVIDFNSIANEEVISNQYVPDGVMFSGLLGLTNPGDADLFNGSPIASNWSYSQGQHIGLTWTATFDTLQRAVGFYSETNDTDDVTIEAFLNGSLVESINFPNTTGLYTVDFIGIQNAGGFDSIQVTTAENHNGFFAMDDFRFQVAAVPEPSTYALMIGGLGLVGFMARRRRQNA